MRSSTTESKLAAYLSYAVGFILVLLPFHALLTTWLGANVGHLDLVRIWKEILITAMAPPALWLVMKKPAIKNWLTQSWLARLIYAYTILTIALGVWALSRHEVNRVALTYALLINLRFLGFFIINLIVAGSSGWLLKNWSKLVLWPAAVVIVGGLIQKFLLPYDFLKHFGYGPKTIPAYQTVDSNIDYRRIQSTLRGANPLGAYLALIVPSALVTIRPQLKRWLFITGAVVVLLFSYSRSAWIGTAVALGIIAWEYWGSKLNIRWLAVTVVFLVVIAGSLYVFKSDQSLQDTLLHTSSSSHSSVSSNAQRLEAIKVATRDVLHQPLGRGPGTAGPASFRNNHPPRIAENYYLQLGQEVGLLGMALFIAVNLVVAWELWQRRHQILPLVLLATLVGISAINLLSHAWADDTLSLLWWGLAGITMSAGILKSKQNGRIQKRA